VCYDGVACDRVNVSYGGYTLFEVQFTFSVTHGYPFLLCSGWKLRIRYSSPKF